RAFYVDSHNLVPDAVVKIGDLTLSPDTGITEHPIDPVESVQSSPKQSLYAGFITDVGLEESDFMARLYKFCLKGLSPFRLVRGTNHTCSPFGKQTCRCFSNS